MLLRPTARQTSEPPTTILSLSMTREHARISCHHSDDMGEGAVPRQNRVTPFGDLVATTDRGTFMGNRGVLHEADGHIKRAWHLKRWIVCLLEFRGRKRSVMTPGRYTELFFLDEATALAAGHRPCSECRHARYVTFCKAWGTANAGGDSSTKITAEEIDRRLHTERMTANHSQRSYVTPLDELPDGVFVTHSAWEERAYLVWGDSLLAWSPGGYSERRQRLYGEEVQVLTPKSTVATIRAGYSPDIHPSALDVG